MELFNTKKWEPKSYLSLQSILNFVSQNKESAYGSCFLWATRGQGVRAHICLQMTRPELDSQPTSASNSVNHSHIPWDPSTEKKREKTISIHINLSCSWSSTTLQLRPIKAKWFAKVPLPADSVWSGLESLGKPVVSESICSHLWPLENSSELGKLSALL